MTKLRGDDMNHIEWLKEVDEKYAAVIQIDNDYTAK